MGVKARHRNVAGAFAVRARQTMQLSERRVLLVDDVLTTGAMVLACIKHCCVMELAPLMC